MTLPLYAMQMRIDDIGPEAWDLLARFAREQAAVAKPADQILAADLARFAERVEADLYDQEDWL